MFQCLGIQQSKDSIHLLFPALARPLTAWQPRNFLCSQGGYMKRMFSCEWAVWTFNASSARVYTGESLWHKQTERTQDALQRLSKTEADLGAQLAEVGQHL